MSLLKAVRGPVKPATLLSSSSAQCCRAVATQGAASQYRPCEIEAKWQDHWWRTSEMKPKKEEANQTQGKRYVLSMFPYPSGSLHMGHVRVYAMSDCLARFHRAQGYQVIHPMGWDAFGLPAENAAIDRDISPAVWTANNIAQMKAQMKRLGLLFDWSREVSTCEPEYYKWTQYIFLQLYKSGLAYQKEALVNWDPVDKTVLANEQVDGSGRSWRSGALVERTYMKQWFLKITSFAEELDARLDNLDWPAQIKAMQRHWIGLSTGVFVDFKLQDGNNNQLDGLETLRVFTTRPETLYGSTFIAVAAEHRLVRERLYPASHHSAATEAVKTIMKSDEKTRKSLDQSRTGAELGVYAIHPLTEKRLPVYVADYVLGDYGTGCVMGVPAHDKRDHYFAQLHDLPVVNVIEEHDAEAPRLINSESFDGLSIDAGRKAIEERLMSIGAGGGTKQCRLRDWLVSRQRYWGAPIPMVHCKRCKEVPVPESDLPVLLPEGVELHGRGGSPLAQYQAFVNTTCPQCGGEAVRDTDTLDTFVDSSWYFLRYLDNKNTSAPVGREAALAMPVDIYIGGIEHAILHLLYARFITAFLFAQGHLPHPEPFHKLLTQGMVHGQTYRHPDTGAYLLPTDMVATDGPDGIPLVKGTDKAVTVTWEKMSKSKHNGVDPQAVIDKYGADAVRLHLLFMAPPDFVLQWNTQTIQGSVRWLQRMWSLLIGPRKDNVQGDEEVNKNLRRSLHRTIEGVTAALENHSFNTAVAQLMTLTNTMKAAQNSVANHIWVEASRTLLLLAHPMVPHIASELWDRLSGGADIGEEKWPMADPDALSANRRELHIQVNGKTRGRIEIYDGATDEDIKQAALQSPMAVKYGITKENIVRVIVPRGGSIANFVLTKPKKL